jgi:hypothetical protein
MVELGLKKYHRQNRRDSGDCERPSRTSPIDVEGTDGLDRLEEALKELLKKDVGD